MVSKKNSYEDKWPLKFWGTGEWQVIEERLDDLEDAKITFNPDRDNLFAALEATSLSETKVAIYGQDPYPTHAHATGMAFSIPEGIEAFPPTLTQLFMEYERDLLLPYPTSGNLRPWTAQGVLLWNVIPTTEAGKSLAHAKWQEWPYLSVEITNRLSDEGIVFALLGSKARDYKQFIDLDKNVVIETSHPSPRGSMNSKTPFVGSNLFSRINEALSKQGKEKIDWRLS